MLDLQRRLTLPDFPGLLVYRDHERPLDYYVVPQAPALETDDRGRPELRVLIHLQRRDGRKVPSGGQVSLTAILATPADQSARIGKSIEALLARAVPPPAPAVSVRLLAPEWAGGKVEVVLTPSLALTGQPSLFGDNRCALMRALGAEQAGAVREQWQRKLPDAFIAYEMTMRVASTTSASAGFRARTLTANAEATADFTRAMDVAAHGTTAATQPIVLKAPLWREGLAQRMTEIDLDA